MKTHSKHLISAITLFAAIAFIPSASAATITVPNFSFETPVQTTTPYQSLGSANTTGSADALTGWNFTTNNTRGYGLVATSSLTTPGASQGSQAAYLQVYNGGNFQTLSTASSLGTISANTLYTLTVAVGAPATWTGDPLVNGGNKAAGETAGEAILSLTGNGTAFANQTIAENVVTQGTLMDYTVTFTTGATGGQIGKALGISLESLKVNYPSGDPGFESDIFDNVELTAVSTIPEPATWALLLGGAGILVVLGRRSWLKV